MTRRGEGTIRRYAVVALFDPIDVGTEVDRRRWPAHVTLVSNFITAAAVDELVGAVHRASSRDVSLHLEFEELALFGPDRDIPVRLVVSPPIMELHGRLVDELASIGDVVADAPDYWRAGYRPHVTLGPSIEAHKGDHRIVRDVVIARLDDAIATIVAAMRLPDEDSAAARVDVRAASRDDLRGLAALKIEWARLGSPPQDADVDEFADALGEWIARQGDSLVVNVAVANGLVVGMAWMVLFERAPDFADRHRLTADIQSVYVTPAYRGRGVGRRLVDELCRAADSRGVPRILVSASTRAIRLYNRAGFEESPLLLQRIAVGDDLRSDPS